MSRPDPAPPRAVIDADIIFSRVLHEMMGRVADDMGLLDLVWSRELLVEAKQALMQRKGLDNDGHNAGLTTSPSTSPMVRPTSPRRSAVLSLMS